MDSNDSQSIPLQQYHGVPVGWSKDALIAEHRKLGGNWSIDGPDATEPGAPDFLPDRYNWLQYRQTLYRVGDGVRAKDAACIEIAVRYIELNYIGSYSGYIREKLARALKNVSPTPSQSDRLKQHFAVLLKENKRLQEFGEYTKLLKRLNQQNDDR
jgi:hypothetical protein